VFPRPHAARPPAVTPLRPLPVPTSAGPGDAASRGRHPKYNSVSVRRTKHVSQSLIPAASCPPHWMPGGLGGGLRRWGFGSVLLFSHNSWAEMMAFCIPAASSSPLASQPPRARESHKSLTETESASKTPHTRPHPHTPPAPPPVREGIKSTGTVTQPAFHTCLSPPSAASFAIATQGRYVHGYLSTKYCRWFPSRSAWSHSSCNRFPRVSPACLSSHSTSHTAPHAARSAAARTPEPLGRTHTHTHAHTRRQKFLPVSSFFFLGTNN
jgi:hypothetical protein